VAGLLVNGVALGVVFGFAFAALWFRALFGPTLRVLLMCAYLAAGVVVVLPLRDVAEAVDQTSSVALVPAVAGMFLTVGVARYLALGLFAREEAQRRDAALVRLGNRLIRVTDRGEIQGAAKECAAALCAATGGLSARAAGALRGRRGRRTSRPAAVPALRRDRRGAGPPAPAADLGRPVRAVALEPVGRRPADRDRHPDRPPDRLTRLSPAATEVCSAAPPRPARPRSA
jgi:hypothetical protein